MDWLLTVYGIGPVLAKDLISRLVAIGYDRKRFKSGRSDCYSRKEIYKMLKNQAIYDTLPEAARVYLRYLPDRGIPRAVIEVLDQAIHKHVTGVKIKIAGSYRRGRATSNDADLVVVQRGDVLSKIMNGMSKSKHVVMIPPYALGPDRASVLFIVSVDKDALGVSKSKYVVKSDIFLTPASEYIFMLLYATGSGGFNILMRAQAKRKGLLLNQHGLYDRNGPIAITSEREIFDHVGVTYRTPENRDVIIKKKKIND